MGQPSPLAERTAQAGAQFVEEAGWMVPAHFGDAIAEYRHARSDCALFDRSHRGKVEVRGSESSRFLHNFLTNDVLSLTSGTGCEAFLTTAKARVVAHLFLYRLGDAHGEPVYWMDLAPGAASKVIAHLERYIISEQVEFTDQTTSFAQISLVGPQAGGILGRVLNGTLPSTHLQATMVPGPKGMCQVRRWDAMGLPGYDVLASVAEVDSLWQALVASGAHPAGRDAYERLRIESGLPAQGPDIDENTFAPEAGRTPTAICYTKGCYLGQEPIVMARDRGHLNRTLVRIELSQGAVPAGSALFLQEKEVGRVTSSAAAEEGSAVGLAYVRRGHQEAGTALQVDAAGQRLPVIIAGPGKGPGS